MGNLTTATLPRHQKPRANGSSELARLRSRQQKGRTLGSALLILLAGNSLQVLAVVGILDARAKAAAVIAVIIVVNQQEQSTVARYR